MALHDPTPFLGVCPPWRGRFHRAAAEAKACPEIVKTLRRDCSGGRWAVLRVKTELLAGAGAPTDLSERGADDRALGVYFIFGLRTDTAQGPLAVLGSPTVSALVYVFGGDRPRGEIVPSPHMGARGKFIILRPADMSKGVWLEERVEIAKDYARAFGRPPPLLLAVAISSDSDDTRMRNRAQIAALAIN
jgi:Protein of unknown function (DUF3047)